MPYAKLDEIELYYEEAGEGYPIVLGHGGFSDITEWDPQVEALSKRFRVIRYDRRGCGRSRPRDVPQLAELWVEDLQAVHAEPGLGAGLPGRRVLRRDAANRVPAEAPGDVQSGADCQRDGAGQGEDLREIDVLPQQAGRAIGD